VTPTATPEPFAIKDERFEANVQQECKTDAKITDIQGNSFTFGGSTISMIGGKWVIWCYGAKHTWIGTLSYAGYTFSSDANNPLQFMVDKARGYVYVTGKGSIKFPDGKVATLPK
jgi:hypothetical protein